MTELHWFLILLVPFLVIGAQGAIAAVLFGASPVRPSRRPVFASMAPAGGAWS